MLNVALLCILPYVPCYLLLHGSLCYLLSYVTCHIMLHVTLCYMSYVTFALCYMVPYVTCCLMLQGTLCYMLYTYVIYCLMLPAELPYLLLLIHLLPFYIHFEDIDRRNEQLCLQVHGVVIRVKLHFNVFMFLRLEEGIKHHLPGQRDGARRAERMG